jgi:hypothetical protein
MAQVVRRRCTAVPEQVAGFIAPEAAGLKDGGDGVHRY